MAAKKNSKKASAKLTSKRSSKNVKSSAGKISRARKPVAKKAPKK